MIKRQLIKFIVITISVLALTGCVSKQQFAKQRYWLDIQRKSTVSSESYDRILVVESFSIDSAFRTNSIVCKKSAYEFENNFYMEYLVPPAKMITEQTRKWLNESGVFAQVLQSGSLVKPTHVLQGHVSKLYVDKSDMDNIVAQVEITFYLLDGKSDEIVSTKTYAVAKSMDSGSTEDYFKALKKALTAILEECEADLVKSFE